MNKVTKLVRQPTITVRDSCPLLIGHDAQQMIGAVKSVKVLDNGHWHLELDVVNGYEDLVTSAELGPAVVVRRDGGMEVIEFSIEFTGGS